MAKIFFTKLARGTGDKKKIYDVKLRIPVELAKRLRLKHGTKVAIKQRGASIIISKTGNRKRVKKSGLEQALVEKPL